MMGDLILALFANTVTVMMMFLFIKDAIFSSLFKVVLYYYCGITDQFLLQVHRTVTVMASCCGCIVDFALQQT